MRRVNIYLADEQAEALRRVGERRGKPVAELVREAIDAWLGANGVRSVDDDEWSRRFDALLARRREIAETEGYDPDGVERDVVAEVRAFRKARAARRR
jgi:CubicO group peptidase (beta-lactamase class C family)